MSDIVSVAMKAVQMMVGDNTSPELVVVSDPGSSGARVFLIKHPRSNITYAVKCVKNGRVSLIEEIARRAIIEPFLSAHLPKILSIQCIGEYEVMISECGGEQSLHSLIINSLLPQSRLRSIWHDVTEILTGIWQETRYYPFMDKLCPRYHQTRCQRITDGVYALEFNGISISDCVSMPIIINGEEYPSIQNTISEIFLVGDPKFGVVCHGDPQPSNVIVNQDCSWMLVDWEWSGRHHDWRAMVSHFYGWWPTRCLTLIDEPQIRIEKGKIHIDYELSFSSHVLAFQGAAISAYRTMSEDNAFSSGDVEAINRYLATLCFGELRFLRLWKRECYLVPLLAEAVKIGAYLRGRSVPGISPFIFNPTKEGK